MKDFQAMKPREVEAYLRQVILDTFGDKTENDSVVVASRGYYTVRLELPGNRAAQFDNFRKTEAPKIAKAIRALGSK